MTIIFENFTDIVGKAVGGYVKIRPVDIRPGVKRSGMVTSHTIVVDLVDGHFRSPELDPGPTVITLRAGYVRKSWTLNIPLDGEHQLWPLVVSSNEYTPEVVGQAQAAASAAAKSAAAAESSARSASTDRTFVATARAEVEQKVSDGAAAVRALLEDDIKATGEARDATEAAREEVKGAAETVQSAVTSTRWDDDRLTVMGKQSPPLTGPKGDRGESGPPGVPETPWVDVPLDSGVTGSVKVRRVGGLVSIRLAEVTGAVDRIGTLPNGYTPPADAHVETYLDGSRSEVASITIRATGEIHAGPRFTPQWAEIDAAWVRDGSGMFFTDQELPPEAVVPEFSSSLRQVEDHMKRAEAARDGAVTARTEAADSATKASASEAAAEGSATDAKGSATAAEGSATAARGSATAAEGSAGEAEASAQSAARSEAQAKMDADFIRGPGLAAIMEKDNSINAAADRAEAAAAGVDQVISDVAGVLAAEIADDLEASRSARSGAEAARDQAVGAASTASTKASEAADSSSRADGRAKDAEDAVASIASHAEAAEGAAGRAAVSESKASGSATTAKGHADRAATEAGAAAQIAAQEKIAELIGDAPSDLDTIYELAAAFQGRGDAVEAIKAALANRVVGSHSSVISSTVPGADTPSNQVTFVVEGA